MYLSSIIIEVFCVRREVLHQTVHFPGAVGAGFGDGCHEVGEVLKAQGELVQRRFEEHAHAFLRVLLPKLLARVKCKHKLTSNKHHINIT